jgi:hypothetical protein
MSTGQRSRAPREVYVIRLACWAARTWEGDWQ